jgi:hypothetical protein
MTMMHRDEEDGSIDEVYEEYLQKLDLEIKRYNQVITEEREKHLEIICLLRVETFGTTVEYEWNNITGYREPRPIGRERRKYLREARQHAREWAARYFSMSNRSRRKARK